MKISIEGGIGCGKSTLLTNLMNTLRLPVFLEPIDTWYFLSKFYEDPKRWGFTFNLEVIMSMYIWKNNNFKALYERSPNSCKYVFKEIQQEDGTITKEESDLFNKLFEQFSWDQDVIIYIKTDPQICFERMQKRGRECENNVSLEYLKLIDKKYDEMISIFQKEKNHIKIFIVDGNKNTDEVYQDVLKILSNL